MDVYAQLTDDDLAVRARSGDEVALNTLVQRYQRVVRRKARSFHVVGIDYDDLVQEGLIGLYRAVKDFDPAKSSFSSFAQLCVTRQMITAVNAARRYKHAALNTSISLDGVVPGDDADGRPRSVADTLVDNRDSVADAVLQRMQAEAVASIGFGESLPLSSYESRVLMYYLRGMTYEEIATRLRRSTKSIDNALQRAKRKFERFLKQEGVTLDVLQD